MFLGLTTSRAALHAASRLISVSLRLSVVDALRHETLAALLRAPWTFVLERRRSDLVQLLTADVGRVGSAIDLSTSFASSLGMAAASVAVAISISPGPALLALALGGVLLTLLRPTLRRARTLGRLLGAANRHFASLVTDSLDAFKLVRAHRVEDRWLGELDNSAREVRALIQRHARANALTGVLIDVGSTAGVVAVLALWFELSGDATASGIVVLYALARVLRQVGGIQQTLQQLVNLLPAYVDLTELRDAALAATAAAPSTAATGATATGASGEQVDGVSPMSAARLATPAAGSTLLRFEGVSFAYPGTEAAAVSGVDLSIAACSTTALVGPSGAGKTTLADVALGLLEPRSGRLEVAGEPAVGAELAAWQRSTAYVPQDTTVLPTTLRQNLTWLAPGASDEDCWEALDRVGADFARRLADGLDTFVGDRGVRLSGGERQRLTIARALLRDPIFLVLDEATSALDDEREEVVRSALERLHGRITVLVIAHRLRTVRGADQVVVMEGGRITESGTWQRLTADPSSRFSAMLDRHAAL